MLIVLYLVKNYFEILILSLDLIVVVVPFQMNLVLFEFHQVFQQIDSLMDQYAKYTKSLFIRFYFIYYTAEGGSKDLEFVVC